MHRHPLARRPLCVALLGIWGIYGSAQAVESRFGSDSAAPVQPQAQASARPSEKRPLLDPVNVTATRTPTAASRIAASVSTITEQDVEEQQAGNIKDALRYEPGVTVRRSAYRPSSAAGRGGRDGDSSINIRGLEGNRVLLMEDGIRLPNAFSFGPLEAGRGDYADLDTLKRIEILRGPASALYGSDGLTGAVNFITKDPADLLSVYGKKTYFSVRPGYDSADRSVGTSATAAAGNDLVQGMIILDGRRGHEVDTRGRNNAANTSRTAANPQHIYSTSALGKLVVTPTSRDTIKLTAETVRRHIDTDVLSAVNAPALLGLTARDRLERNRLSLDYDVHDTDHRWFQTAHLQFYYQDAKQDQRSYETRGRGQPPRMRDNHYAEHAFGGSVFAESGFATGPFAHKLLYGADGSVDRIKSLRNGVTPGAGEIFPSKPFPDTSYTLFGAFVQDQVGYGKLTMTPGLRFDAYRLSPRSGDPQFPGKAVVSSDHALSPRLAALYEVSPALIPYAQYAHGFRTPMPDQVNNSFSNPIHGYTSIGNPDLKPEKSDTIEAGLRGTLGTGYGPLRYSAAAFVGHYRDFISQRVVSGSGRPSDPLVFQYVNFAKARIHGFEGRAEWVMPAGITLKAALALTKGSIENQSSANRPLDTINPFSAVFGVRYEPSEHWFAQADLLFQAAKKQKDIATDGCEGKTCYAPPSSFVVDLRGGYRFSQHVIGYIGIHNLFNRKYWNWSDVRGIANTSNVLDAYTAAGRSVAASMKIDF